MDVMMNLNPIRTNAQVAASTTATPATGSASGNFATMLPQTATAAGGAQNQNVSPGLLQAVSNLSTDLQSLLTYLQAASSPASGTQQAGSNTEASVFGGTATGSSASGKPGTPPSDTSASDKPTSQTSQSATLSPVDQASADIEAALASLQAAADRQTAAVDAFSARIDAIGNSLSNAQSPGGSETSTAQQSNSSDVSPATATSTQNGNGSTTSSSEDTLNSFVELVARDLAAVIRSYSSNGSTLGLGINAAT